MVEVEDICYKYQLPYEKSMILKTDLVTFEQIKKEIDTIFHRISENYAFYQQFGAIVLIELNKNIISGFKILNQEMRACKKIRKLRFPGENENIYSRTDINKVHTSKINKLIKKLECFNLPRNRNLYIQLYNNIKEEDSYLKYIEIIDELSKTNNEINYFLKNSSTNYQEENKNFLYNQNLLSCLIPFNTSKSKYEKSEVEYPIDQKITDNLKSNTFEKNIDSGQILSINKISKLKETELLIDRRPIIITKKSQAQKKKRVKFVDAVYNKKIAEIIPIKCYKSHNVKNHFGGFSGEICCSAFKTTSCCLII